MLNTLGEKIGENEKIKDFYDDLMNREFNRFMIMPGGSRPKEEDDENSNRYYDAVLRSDQDQIHKFARYLQTAQGNASIASN